MAVTFRNWISNDPLNGISSEFLNILVEMAKSHLRKRSSLRAGQVQVLPATQDIRIRNSSGANLDQYAIVRAGAPVVVPSESQRFFFGPAVFDSATPLSTSPFAITQEPSQPQALMKTVFSGISWVRVLVNHTVHQFADVIPGDHSRLQTGNSGRALIIALGDAENDGSSSDDDERWALVDLNQRANDDGTVHLWADCTIAGAIVTMRYNSHVPFVFRTAPGRFLFVFDIDFGDRWAFTWAGSIGNSDDTFHEVDRSSSSVVVQTSSGDDPEDVFGITVHGKIVDVADLSDSGSSTVESGSDGPIVTACCPNGTPANIKLCIDFTEGGAIPTPCVGQNNALIEAAWSEDHPSGRGYVVNHVASNGKWAINGVLQCLGTEGWWFYGAIAFMGDNTCGILGIAYHYGIYLNQSKLQPDQCDPFLVKIAAFGHWTFSQNGEGCPGGGSDSGAGDPCECDPLPANLLITGSGCAAGFVGSTEDGVGVIEHAGDTYDAEIECVGGGAAYNLRITIPGGPSTTYFVTVNSCDPLNLTASGSFFGCLSGTATWTITEGDAVGCVDAEEVPDATDAILDFPTPGIAWLKVATTAGTGCKIEWTLNGGSDGYLRAYIGTCPGSLTQYLAADLATPGCFDILSGQTTTGFIYLKITAGAALNATLKVTNGVAC